MIDKIRKELERFMEERLFYEDLPGLALGVGWAGIGMDFQGACGYKDYVTKEKLSTENIFHVCSIAKLFAGTAIMQLWEDERLSLDTRIVEILPWFSIDDKRYEQISIRQVLTHTAGLADVLDYAWDRPRLDDGALRGYVRSEEVAGSKLRWGPEEGRFCYSNIGYDVLGCVIEEISRMSFEDYVKKNIFDPLDMGDSTLMTHERLKDAGISGNPNDPEYIKASLSLENLSRAGMAMPHRKDETRHIVKERYYPYNREHGPSSTLTTNLRDMKKWADAHLNKTGVLRPETYDLVWGEHAVVPNNGEKMGLAWFKREQGGYELYGHEGADDGFRSSFWICPELKLHIVTMSNLSKAPVKKISKAVFDLLIATL